jgi:hypothetical protein
MGINLQESIRSVEKAIGCLVETVFDNGSLKDMSVGGFIDANYNAKFNEAALNEDLLASDIVENGLSPSSASYNADMLNDDAITPSIQN